MRYRDESKGQLDDRSQGDGDSEWKGVWAQGSPVNIGPGWVAAAENMTFSDREAGTRKGSYGPASFQHSSLGTIFGAGLWNDRDGRLWLLLATAAGVWRMADGRTARLIPIPEPIAAACELVQEGATMRLFRGSELTPWQWDGNVFHAWEAISQADLGDGTVPIPNGPQRIGLRPVVLNDRAFIPYDGHRLAISDIGVYDRYDRSFHDYRIGGFRGGEVVALLPFGQTNLLVFNSDSVQILSNLTGDLFSVALASVHTTLGCVAGGTVASVGGDVFFLSQTGVYRVRQIIQDRAEAAAEAVSEPIKPILARINFAAVAKAHATVFGRYYWLVVPLDGATEPNAILRYDTITGAWQGIDRYRYHDAEVQIHALIAAPYQGEPRLYAVDFNRPCVHLLEQGWQQVAPNANPTLSHRPIPASLTTRAYTLGENQDKRYQRGLLELRGWAPSYSVAGRLPGANDVDELIPATTPDRTKYKVFNLPDYAPSNANDDHAAPDREDYSVDIGTPFDPDDAGIDFDLQQTHHEPFTVRRNGRHVQLALASTTGQLTVVSTQLDADPGSNSLRSK